MSIADAIHAAYPRLALGRSIVDDIVQQIRDIPERGPQFSIGLIHSKDGTGNRRLELGRLTDTPCWTTTMGRRHEHRRHRHGS
jgi:hypothetical protein